MFRLTRFSIVLFCVVGCLSMGNGREYKGKYVRNNRPRGSLIKRPIDPYTIGYTKRPVYIEGSNQWKPILHIPTRQNYQTPKYYSKPIVSPPKYNHQNIIHPIKSNNQPSNSDFITKQSLLVADEPNHSTYKPEYKKKYQNIQKKSPSQQYEVHESLEDDVQNQYRYSDKSVNTPKSYSEIIGPEKHPVHYQDSAGAKNRGSATRTHYY